jgi:hypothetical protein
MGAGLHPDLEPLAFLLGSWVGEGTGRWPAEGAPFVYGEEIAFGYAGEPYLLYAERSWDPADGAPIHFERGFFRPAGPGRLEAVLAHPLGIVEVAEGTVTGTDVDLAATSVTTTSTGSAVTDLRRRMRVADGALTYELDMAMREVPLTRHLTGRLERA